MKFRERFKDEASAGVDLQFNCTSPNGGWGPMSVAVPIWTRKRLVEHYTPNSQGSHSSWKEFHHHKVVSDDASTASSPGSILVLWYENAPPWRVSYYEAVVPGRSVVASDGVITAYGDLGCPNNGLPSWWMEGSEEGFVPAPDGVDSMVSIALKRLIPTIKSDLSLVNSVIELKDFKSLPSLVPKVKKAASLVSALLATFKRSLISGGSWWRKRLARQGGLTLRELSKTSSEAYLELQFNVLPLLSDISGIHTALTDLNKRINALVSQVGRPQRKHYRFSWVEHEDLFEVGADGYFVVPVGVGTPYTTLYRLQPARRVTYKPTVFHAEIEYNIMFAQYQLVNARVLSFLDAMGVNLNPQIIWNAIPWSFVVDWVVGVSSWLGQFKRLNMEPQINIRRFLWSITRQRQILCSRHVSNLDNKAYNGPWGSLPVVTETAYRRSVGLPSRSSIESSGLSPKEFSLGLALVITRRKGRRRISPVWR